MSQQRQHFVGVGWPFHQDAVRPERYERLAQAARRAGPVMADAEDMYVLRLVVRRGQDWCSLLISKAADLSCHLIQQPGQTMIARGMHDKGPSSRSAL